ncbi:MAG: lipid-binding protein [Flavobacteriales bacterium]|nr:lipid-binding protein [Flavobacteriales bacterium]|tara:strand:+ start:7429 stop:8025 length:597 start_codon:yes stop_codon:yes gene_type:complete
MKNIFLSLILSVATLLAFASKPHIDYIKVDAQRSTVKWIGSKINESHEGTVNIQKGMLHINHGVLVGGQMSIDMNSITTTDIENEKYRAKLDSHLKDADFFNVKEFPSAVITIKKVIKGLGNTYEIFADLTIKEITHSINFKADVYIKGLNYKASANIKIDRTKWDIKYKSASFFKDLGDRLIRDEIEFDISLMSATQ